jgi:hypothetical protein
MKILKEMVFKTKRTFFTEEKITNAIKNIEQHSWAKQIRDHVVAEAEKYLSYGCDFLWNSVTTQNVPRSYGVNQTLGCPVCKKDIEQYGNYPWIGDPVRGSLPAPAANRYFLPTILQPITKAVKTVVVPLTPIWRIDAC